ncbi:uncharacterized protein [Oryza sativa Japonica Group]|nr:uncharacterized protein LOC107276625 [Oryza sativa Japonica Group]EAY72517.1 hypothetical protein OsI_00378 [Oryza sativa Indica Group]EAZ10527.1 hypothetical protein OsJ_00359 [Oryza sativa Japonica Group]BAS70378.1 Os01g0147100 [Oryza sativa Japonica Group]
MSQAGIDNLNLELGMVGAQVAGGEAPAAGTSPETTVKALRGVGFLTLVISVGTLVYKPPHGLLFQLHVLAYYLTLVGIFFAGVVEVWTAFWVSEAGVGGGRRAFGRAVLWASVVPLAAALGIGGYTVLANVPS